MRMLIVRLGAAALVAAAGCFGCSGAGGGGGSSAVVASAASQSDALALARDSDLPAIATADKLVITVSTGEIAETTTAAELAAVRAALVVAERPPSGGETWATLQWFTGESKVRELWVYGDGEWGVHRPGVSWTLGRSAALITAIQGLLKDG